MAWETTRDHQTALIRYSDEALNQVRSLRSYYRELARDTALRALDRALADAEAKIEFFPEKGLPAPRPYPQLAHLGWAWIKSGRYWIGYQNHPAQIIVAVLFETANIPRRM